MATAKQLPSGNWRVRVFSHIDENGNKKYESFTEPTKAEAEMKAAKFKANNDRRRSADITLQEALENYINANKGSLSASTLKGYTMDAKRIDHFGRLKIRKICSMDLQNLVSYLTNQKGYAAKTVKNTYCTVLAALDASDVDTNFKVNLPRQKKKRRIAPEDDIVALLLKEANPVMRRAIILAGFHSMRRSEICGLTYGDLKGNVLWCHSAVIEGLEGIEHRDLTKTIDSDREIYLEDWEIPYMGHGFPQQRLVPICPGTVTDNFKRLTTKLHIENVTLHTLRAYFASSAVRAGVKDLYAAHMGGWTENSSALKKLYQREFVSEEERSRKELANYFYENVKKKAL